MYEAEHLLMYWAFFCTYWGIHRGV